jgi:hypothetical protein
LIFIWKSLDKQTVNSPADNTLVTFKPMTTLSPGAHSLTIEVSDGTATASCTFTVTVNADTTAPTITTCPANRNVSADGTCAGQIPDLTGEVVASDNCTAAGPLTITQSPAAGTSEPLGRTTVTITVKDAALNATTCAANIMVVDTTAPTITCPADVKVITTSTNGMTVNYPAPTASDTCSAVSTNYSNASGSSFGLGTTTVTATATDTRGNSAQCSFKVNVVYSCSGVLQPINADGSSVFKLGTTVQVKFQLTGASAGIANASARLSFTKLPISIPPDPVNEGTSTAAATTGNLFRYDSKAKQYVFNWGTKGLTAGLYQLKIDLGDGVSYPVNVALK